MQHRPEIDGLRALAVVPVLFFHAGLVGFSGGYVGVDIFFVISGYLITGLLLKALAENRFSLALFYERRARRILPALVLVSLVSLPAAWITLDPQDLKDFAQSLVAVSVFSANILFWLESGYWDSAAALKPMLHSWSLGVEEQYYLLFPLLLAIGWQRYRRQLPWLLILIALASFLAAIWQQRHDQQAQAFYLLHTRAWELLIGAGLAWWEQQSKTTAHRHANALSLLGLIAILIAISGYDKTTPIPAPGALLPTLGAALIIAYAQPRTLAYRLLTQPIIIGIGLISYSLYLWHQPLLAFARHLSHTALSSGQQSLIVLLAFPLAWASWRYVETPFRQPNFLSRRQILALSLSASGLLLSIGLIGTWQQGFPQRLNTHQQQLLKTAAPSPERARCHTGGLHHRPPSQACQLGAPIPAEQVQWAVWSDSHGVELAYALGQALGPNQQASYQYSFGSCPPNLLPMPQQPGCHHWNLAVYNILLNSPHISHIVIASRINTYLYGEHRDHYPKLPDEHDRAWRDRLWANQSQLLQSLIDAGKTVYWIDQAPELPKSLHRLIYQHPQAGPIAGVPFTWWQQRDIYARHHPLPQGVQRIPSSALFCPDQQCLASDGQQAWYFDDNHPSVAGATRIVQQILQPTPQPRSINRPYKH